MSSKVEAVLQSLTLEEKISLLAGKDFWETVPIPDKGVPAIKVRPESTASDLLQPLTNDRPAMDLTVPVAKCLQEVHELHVSLQQCAQPRRGILQTQNV
jgi:phage gp46-like protein